MSISILIADDHTLVRQGLRAALESQPDFKILGEARDGVEAIEFSERLKPDVLILDISMPRLNGLDAIPSVRQVSPRSRIVILSSHSHSAYIRAAMNRGAVGYIRKNGDKIETLIDTIREVVAGK
jgi:DNA-binding NarL/FixJ family response regulator